MKLNWKLFFSFLFLLGFTISCASKEELANLQSKQIILESRLIDLEKKRGKSTNDLQDEVKKLKTFVVTRVDKVQKNLLFFLGELNKLKKDIEGITNSQEINEGSIRKVERRIQRMNKRLGDQAITVTELHQFFSFSEKGEITKDEKERTDFQTAFQSFKQRKFKQAQKQLTLFRRHYPKSKKTDNALFYLAYIQFLQAKYDNASLHFYELLEQYPATDKKNDARWWLAVALERSGDVNAARSLYKKLVKLHSSNPIQIKAKYRLEELKSFKK
ncbi:MAG: TolA-binding protein [bacterium]|jgi:TolA-binding protein